MTAVREFTSSPRFQHSENVKNQGWVKVAYKLNLQMHALNSKGELHHFVHQDEGMLGLDNQEFVKDGHHIRNTRLHITGGGSSMTKYQIIMSQDEDGIFVAECPAIPGCVSEGATSDEALENIKEAIQGCLEARRDLQMPLSADVYEVEV